MSDRVFLSVFAPGANGLIWKRVDAHSGEVKELTTLPPSARPLQRDVHVSANGAEAIILEGRLPADIRRFSLEDGSPLELPSYEHQQLLDAGYDQEGRALLFYGDRDELEWVEDASDPHWVHRGQRYAYAPELRPGQRDWVLVSVYRVGEGGAFELVEKKVIAQSWPGDLVGLENGIARDTSADVRFEEVAFMPNNMLGSDPWSRQWGQADEYLEWYRSDRHVRKVFFRAYRDGRGLAPPIVVEAASGFTRLSEWDKYSFYSNDLRGEIRGDYLLVTNDSSVARLHALETGAVVWEAPAKARVWLWPA